MKSFGATINISVSQGIIWRILTDASKYPEWDPGTERIEGEIALGEQIVVYSKGNQKPLTLNVAEFVPGEKMTWLAYKNHGFVTLTRTFHMGKLRDGSIDFTLREEYYGIFAPLFFRPTPETSKIFENFVVGLKSRAQAQARLPQS